MKAYADSSFILGLYLQQEHSQNAVAFMRSHAKPLPFNPWHRIEVRNAIRLAVFRGWIDELQKRTQLRRIDADLLEETVLVHASMDWISVLRVAERLGAAHAQSIGCRAGDLFHVAAAVQSGAELFLTFDDRQALLAKAAGLTLQAASARVSAHRPL